jgi:hypothetical protein
MINGNILTHEFVEYVPRELKAGVLYVSIPFATVIHKCCCGCGQQVVTPLAPSQWTLIFDGKSVSLHPSIGNWNFPCRAHYWIRQDRVIWASELSARQIAAVQQQDLAAIRSQFHEVLAQDKGQKLTSELPVKRTGFVTRCKKRLFGKWFP